ncbi:hypothetical protein SEVIR_8G048460v4 [Setaria viridis]|uniref:Uncharacterized protein n=1 Tax=Setaria viridis TaxID=4556 RepID=A0A4U6TFK7_SETVI|nr:hypothetical protein SEVIR_8G048460v2 [Setaria viridis]
MDISDLDLCPGLDFSAKVRSALGVRVSPHTSTSPSKFWLLATFTRSRVKLSEDNVGFMLQSALGGSAPRFEVSEIADWIFKFCVSSKDVGLLVHQLGFFQCEIFKVAFNLWNDRGLNFARSVLASSQGTNFPWVSVASKKSRVASSLHPPLTGANTIPMGSSNQHTARSNHRQSVFSRIGKKWIQNRSSDIDGPTFSNPGGNGIDLDLNLGQSTHFGSQRHLLRDFPPLQPSLKMLSDYGVRLGRNCCSQCLSSSHSRVNCNRRIRCGLCFRLGHTASFFRYPTHFPGLTKESPSFPSIHLGNWSNIHTWFRSSLPMTGGPGNSCQPTVGTFQELGCSLLGVSPTFSEATILWQCPRNQLPMAAASGSAPSPSWFLRRCHCHPHNLLALPFSRDHLFCNLHLVMFQHSTSILVL